MNEPRWERRHIYWLSRAVIGLSVSTSIGSLLWTPSTPLEWLVDIVGRTYLMFVGTVMAHEGTHGHLGRSKAANFWWGRLALVPPMVPYTNFRKTHQLHHAHTNIPEKDPDLFLKPRHVWEIPVRALAMSYQWFFWLRRRNRITRADLEELGLNYVGILAIYGIVFALAEPTRLVWGLVPPLIGVAILLWYPFAIKTHEGYSAGSPESRSHNYYGRVMYWFSLGLSMHRVHHMDPTLAWIELRDHVEAAPGAFRARLLPRRDIRRDASGA